MLKRPVEWTFRWRRIAGLEVIRNSLIFYKISLS
jgi:hypothetical protein